MTLADARYSDAVATASGEARTLSRSQLDMMRAFFCYEFEVSRLERTSLPEATPEVVAEWVGALGMSGLFAPAELLTMAEAWLREPESLLALLVGDVDEIAARREVGATVEGVISSGADTGLMRAS
ncbi:hypothetical protein [Rhodococcus sp. 1168]|uniref:hypothetical protein n=1 Tax=Rhodococcus sp. 1168 TaxID=2018041 RepID=UPI000A0A9A1B|nr:hypothetical protein [Rhodococcus sp. 1168]ORI14497.1 hypothetical protein BJI47_06610 [Rhodococcus sp. 1168]